MLNPFPEFLTYGILAPALIRITLGCVLIYLASLHYRDRHEVSSILRPLMGKLAKGIGYYFASIEVIVGILLIAGAWTQIAALVVAALCLKSLILRPHLRGITPLSRTSYALMCVMSLSLLLSGAGGMAFDIPL
jgi:uncharacterized membrane protein YphA (DoxX/SURF4 family)